MLCMNKNPKIGNAGALPVFKTFFKSFLPKQSEVYIMIEVACRKGSVCVWYAGIAQLVAQLIRNQ